MAESAAPGLTLPLSPSVISRSWMPLAISLVATVARDLMPYVYPKLASAQVSAQVEAKLTIVPAISLTLSVIRGMEGADQTIHPYDGSLEKVH